MGILSGGKRRRWRAEYAETADPRQQISQKLWILRIIVLAAFAALAIQLGRLQLIEGSHFQQRAELNQLRIEPITPSRGIITDRNRTPVVANVPGFAAAIVAADIPADRDLQIAG
jgi:penicillin-binding protein 2